MNRPSYKELWLDEYKDRDEQLQWIRNAVNGNAKFRNSEPPYSEEEELAREIMQMHARIAELSQAVGLITTLKPTMVMDADHPLDMAKEVVEYVSTIITNTQQANRGLGANYVYELNENIKLTARIAELEAKNNRLVELAEGLADMVDWSGCDCDKPFILTEWEEFIAEVQE